MAYPEILYKGQYTLKRVLTMPAAVTLTADDIGKLVTIDASGIVTLAPADAAFFGILRSINTKDYVASVDFSGVHELVASADIPAGTAVVPASDTAIKAGTGTTRAVTLNQALANENVQIFFLN